ncbi:MAG: hypothetical protein CFE29_14730 [Bradyrhizobiaceae bacterium PARB1]|jgi:hypothetical protein|nr:MAG: hypothetical protein CFE29_14730 [Bradyrhizobiaceae bacterium PARB1]
MPRYYFDLIDGKTVPDVAGQLLRDTGVAIRVADKLARDIYKIRPELRDKDYAISVRDEAGDEVHRADVAASDAMHERD